MELKTYARTLLRHWLLILLLAVIAGAAAYSYSARSTPLYRATAHLSVTPSEVDFFTGEAVQRLLNNYAARLRSKTFAAQYGAALMPPATGDQLAGKVRAVAAPSDYRISIEVDDRDPVRAQQIANAAAYGFVERIRSETAGREKQAIYLEVLDQAEVPGAPLSPRPRRDAFGAALAGAIIGAAIAFLLEFWDDTLQTVDEATTLFGLPALGTIPGPQKTGVFHGISRRWPARRYRVHKSPLAGG
ncbi:MAG TPA: Wzz/FepE/Etk N-terminal domain-containing protein [Chloroflexota bacterium]|nr:Wzz/FepE/Etk N-terminal domain-containing protein [Chloroflexota bacterium]